MSRANDSNCLASAFGALACSDGSERRTLTWSTNGTGLSSPNNPGVTTYIDGVPQLNANSSPFHAIDDNVDTRWASAVGQTGGQLL